MGDFGGLQAGADFVKNITRVNALHRDPRCKKVGEEGESAERETE